MSPKVLTPLQKLIREGKECLASSREADDGHDINYDQGYLSGIRDAVKALKKEPVNVYVAVWHTDGGDPVTFVGRTQKAIDAQVIEAISEYYESVVGKKLPKKKDKVLQTYFQCCSDSGICEWLTETKEELK